MLSVQNYNFTPSRTTSFRANEEKNVSAEKPKVTAYKTNAGLKTGAVYAAIGTALAISANAFSKFDSSRIAMTGGKKMWLTLPLGVLLCLGCGALVDKKINDKNAQFAEKLNTDGKKAVLRDENRSDITKKENVFYRTSMGKILGPILGAVVTPLDFLVNSATLPKAGNTKLKIPGPVYVLGAVLGAAGGLILGAITDKVANKGAAKFADKQAFDA